MRKCGSCVPLAPNDSIASSFGYGVDNGKPYSQISHPCESCFIIFPFAKLESRLCLIASQLVRGVRNVHAQQDPLNRHILSVDATALSS